MKYFLPVFLLLFALSARAQITLEHTYPNSDGAEFGLVEVDSGVWKYVQNTLDTIRIYNLDHSLERIIAIPPFGRGTDFGTFIVLIAKKLFNMDGSYGYLLWSADSTGHNILRIFKEDGTVLFGCENC
ncbi:MAG TPA: hypothetical protein VFH95_00020 [Candidatus Kapabacteria bacterium]|nr:hypothetical protein [Candidatus Kapabacteria bacterium]